MFDLQKSRVENLAFNRVGAIARVHFSHLAGENEGFFQMNCDMELVLVFYQFQDLIVMLINNFTTSTKQPIQQFLGAFVGCWFFLTVGVQLEKITMSHV